MPSKKSEGGHRQEPMGNLRNRYDTEVTLSEHNYYSNFYSFLWYSIHLLYSGQSISAYRI